MNRSILHSQCTFSTPGGVFYRRAHTNPTTIPFASYRVPIYTPGSRAAMWIIKCLAEGQRYRATVGIEHGLSAWESSGHTTIPRHLINKTFTDYDTLFMCCQFTAKAQRNKLLYWRNSLLKNRVGRSVIFLFFFTRSMPIYTHIPWIFIKHWKYRQKYKHVLETLKLDHLWSKKKKLYIVFSLNYFMKISYDNCAISYENCAIIKIKITSRVGGIFRVGRVTPIQQQQQIGPNE